MLEANVETFETGSKVLESSQTYMMDYRLQSPPDSLQEQINHFSRERLKLRELGTEWSELGRLLKKSKKVQRKEFRRLVKEGQIPLDLGVAHEL